MSLFAPVSFCHMPHYAGNDTNCGLFYIHFGVTLRCGPRRAIGLPGGLMFHAELSDRENMIQRTTLLAAVWESGGNADAILARLESGELHLTGNFKGHENEIVRDAQEIAQAGDWERKIK